MVSKGRDVISTEYILIALYMVPAIFTCYYYYRHPSSSREVCCWKVGRRVSPLLWVRNLHQTIDRFYWWAMLIVA